jgi:hypothetical protein
MRLLFAAALAVTCLPALAQESVTVEGQKNPDAAVICVHSDPPLGSHIGAGQECHTKAEWRERQRYFQQSTNDYANMVSHGGSVNNALLGAAH